MEFVLSQISAQKFRLKNLTFEFQRSIMFFLKKRMSFNQPYEMKKIIVSQYFIHAKNRKKEDSQRNSMIFSDELQHLP